MENLIVLVHFLDENGFENWDWFDFGFFQNCEESFLEWYCPILDSCGFDLLDTIVTSKDQMFEFIGGAGRHADMENCYE